MVALKTEPDFAAEDLKKYASILGDDVPPKATPRTRPAPAKKAPVTKGNDVSLPQVREALLNMYTMIGFGLSSMPNDKLTPIGETVIAQREACVDSIINAAEKDARLRAMLGKLVTTSVYGQIAVAHAPIIMSIYFAVNPPKFNFPQEQPAEETNHTAPLFGVS